MRKNAINQFFQVATISSYQGSLSSLAQAISRNTGVGVQGYDILDYFIHNNGLPDYCINVCFAKGNIRVLIEENTIEE